MCLSNLSFFTSLQSPALATRCVSLKSPVFLHQSTALPFNNDSAREPSIHRGRNAIPQFLEGCVAFSFLLNQKKAPYNSCQKCRAKRRAISSKQQFQSQRSSTSRSMGSAIRADISCFAKYFSKGGILLSRSMPSLKKRACSAVIHNC